MTAHQIIQARIIDRAARAHLMHGLYAYQAHLDPNYPSLKYNKGLKNWSMLQINSAEIKC